MLFCHYVVTLYNKNVHVGDFFFTMLQFVIAKIYSLVTFLHELVTFYNKSFHVDDFFYTR